MKRKILQMIALCLVVMLIIPGCTFLKEQREGIRLTVDKTDGTTVKGELIKVKDDDTLVISSMGLGVAVPVNKIRKIKVRKTGGSLGNSAAKGFGYGALVGAGLGAGFSAMFDPSDGVPLKGSMLFFGAVFGVVGTVVGIFNGATGATVYKVKLEGKPTHKIKRAIEKLKKKARLQGD